MEYPNLAPNCVLLYVSPEGPLGPWIIHKLFTVVLQDINSTTNFSNGHVPSVFFG